MSQLPENMRVLRLFGAEKPVVEALLAMAQRSKGIKLQSMEQGGETLILLEAVTQSGSATMAVLNAWQERIEEECKGAFYGIGDTTLTQAMVDAFVAQKGLFACVDAQTGAMMANKLQAVTTLEKIYDFGSHSYAHPKYGRKIAMGSKFAAKYPDQTAQQVAGQAKVAYQYSGADFVLSVLPLEDASQLILVGDKTGYWLRRVAEGENASLWAIDMLRRAALGLAQAKGTIRLAYGAKMPAFAVAKSIAGQDEAFVAPAQEEFDAPPAPEQAKKGAAGVLLSVLFVLFVALLAVGAFYLITGGDLTSLWNQNGPNQYQVSSAMLL